MSSDALPERWHPVPAVAPLELGQHPVVARDPATTGARPAAARHDEAGSSRVCRIVDGRLVAWLEVSPRCDLVRADVPERRIAAVVAEVGVRARWEHEMDAVADGDRVDVRGGRVGSGGSDQGVELGRADEPPAETEDDRAGPNVLACGQVILMSRDHASLP